MTTTETPAVSAPEASEQGAAIAQPSTPAAPRGADRPLSITALVLGGASIVFGQTFLLPIAAMVLGVIGYRQEPLGRTFAIIGIALGAFAVFGWILFAFLGFAFALPLLPFLAIGLF